MRRERSITSPNRIKLCASIFLAVGLALLVGCQGFSSGSSNNQNQQTTGSLSFGAAALNFGTVTAGTTKTLTVSVSNTGSTSLTISSASVSTKYFSVTSPSLPATIAAGQSASLVVAFTPNAAGNFTATAAIGSNASSAVTNITLSGNGTTSSAQLAVSPATLNLGSVVVGSSGSASGTLTASGADVTITGATTSNSVFSIGGLSLPTTIPAGQSVSYSITFSPLTAGTANATLTLASNAQSSTTTEALSGSGTAAPTHTVNLSWNASSSSGISGYNIYRAVYTSSACGSFSKINSAVDTTTLYTDGSVVDGTSYCYAATAVNTSSQESSYSNIASNVQIPAP